MWMTVPTLNGGLMVPNYYMHVCSRDCSNGKGVWRFVLFSIRCQNLYKIMNIELFTKLFRLYDIFRAQSTFLLELMEGVCFCHKQKIIHKNNKIMLSNQISNQVIGSMRNAAFHEIATCCCSCALTWLPSTQSRSNHSLIQDSSAF